MTMKTDDFTVSTFHVHKSSPMIIENNNIIHKPKLTKVIAPPIPPPSPPREIITVVMWDRGILWCVIVLVQS